VSARSANLRDMLQAPGIMVAPGAADGLTARLVEEAGFPAIYLTGGGIARSYGKPDFGTVTYVEVADRIRSIAAVTTKPLIADLDAGHGGVSTLIRALAEYAQAGASAAHLEDREVPRRRKDSAANLLDPREMEGRVRAALHARPDADFVVIARTDCLPVTGLSDAINRAKRYVDAGADMVYVEHMSTRAHFETVARAIAAPKLVSLNKGLGQTPPATELADMGYRILTLPADAQLAAIYNMRALLRHIAERGTSVGFEAMVPFVERDAIVDAAPIRLLEDEFLI
jgi:2-methylisocitrate lyase-like PEP mutase family enzyme